MFKNFKVFGIFRQPQANKAQIKLKIAQLYKADGFAVRELLKIADVLFKATTMDGMWCILLFHAVLDGRNCVASNLFSPSLCACDALWFLCHCMGVVCVLLLGLFGVGRCSE